MLLRGGLTEDMAATFSGSGVASSPDVNLDSRLGGFGDVGAYRALASGAGVEPHEIKQFLVQFDQVRTLMRQMAKMSLWERMKMVTGLGKMGAFMPGSNVLKSKVGTGHRKSAKERAEERKKKKKKR